MRCRSVCATIPIQPLVIRANEGDCVQITVTNNASGGAYGMAIDGLPFDRPGDKVGKNFSGEVPQGQSAVFRYYVPNERTLEGSHYISPGAGHRAAIDHGLFGVLSVEPPGSQWLSPEDARHADRVRLGSNHLAAHRAVVP